MLIKKTFKKKTNNSYVMSPGLIFIAVHIFLIIFHFENLQKKVRCKTVSIDSYQFILKCNKVSFGKMLVPLRFSVHKNITHTYSQN